MSLSDSDEESSQSSSSGSSSSSRSSSSSSNSSKSSSSSNSSNSSSSSSNSSSGSSHSRCSSCSRQPNLEDVDDDNDNNSSDGDSSNSDDDSSDESGSSSAGQYDDDDDDDDGSSSSSSDSSSVSQASSHSSSSRKFRYSSVLIDKCRDVSTARTSDPNDNLFTSLSRTPHAPLPKISIMSGTEGRLASVRGPPNRHATIPAPDSRPIPSRSTGFGAKQSQIFSSLASPTQPSAAGTAATDKPKRIRIRGNNFPQEILTH